MKTLAYVQAAFLVVLTAADAANYYVNDSNLDGDVYCTAAGNNAYAGISPAAPKATIQSVLDNYDLGPGDTIWVDTGTYYHPGGDGASVLIQASDGGATGSYMTICGSTNYGAGGTVLNRQSSLYPTVQIQQASWIALKHLRITEGQWGIYFYYGDNLLVEDCRVWNNYGSGLDYEFGGTSIVRRTSFLGNAGAGFFLYGSQACGYLDNCTFWANSSAATWVKPEIYVANVMRLLSVSNTILLADGDKHCCVYFSDGEHRTYWGDYNDFYARNGGYIADVSYRLNDLASWQAYTTGDVHSISLDPQMTGDGHLMSRAPAGTWWYGTWTNFDVNSPCIDMACPTSLFTNEPAPNGGRINMGAYGNTPQASKSADSDGDGLYDNQETFWYGTNPDKTDSDNDGYNDFSELIAGTSATNGTNFFSVANQAQTNKTRFTMRWYGVSGRTYQPQWRTNLVNGGSWSNCTGLIGATGLLNTNLIGSNTWITAVDTNANGKTFRYYRVRVTKP